MDIVSRDTDGNGIEGHEIYVRTAGEIRGTVWKIGYSGVFEHDGDTDKKSKKTFVDLKGVIKIAGEMITSKTKESKLVIKGSPMDTSFSQLRMKELSDITGIAVSNLNRWLRQNDVPVTKGGKKITGVSHSAVETLFRSRGQADLYKPGIYIWNSQTGGSAKTSSVVSTSHAYARISCRDNSPVILLDTDSQSSLTLQLMGEVEEEIPVLADYLEGRASLREMIKPLGNNVFIIPSSLDNAYLEKIVSTPKKVKESGLRIFEDIFEVFGNRTKVFVDTPPALSGMTHSLLLGANNIGIDIERVLCIPIRCDSFALKGAEIAVSEFEELIRTYNLDRNVDIVPYMVMYDQRTNNSITAMKALLENVVLNKYEICPIVIRASAEAAKAINKNQNIYSDGKLSALAKDYMDFMLSIMGWSGK